MKRHGKQAFILIVLLFVSWLSVFHFMPLVHASTTTTFEVTDDDWDGWCRHSMVSYADTRAASSSSAFFLGDADTGQDYDALAIPPDYGIDRGLVSFDTSSLPDKITVSTVVLKLYGYKDPAATHTFNVTFQKWTDAQDGISYDDYSAWDNVTYGTFAPSTTVGWWNTTLTNVTGIINGRGFTGFSLRSSEDIAGIAPEAYYDKFYPEGGDNATYHACLDVTYTADLPYTSLEEPSNGSTITTVPLTVNFNYSCMFDTAIQNSSLWLNLSGTWQRVQGNSSAIVNNTKNTISYTFASEGAYIWNVGVFNTTTEVFDIDGNYTLTMVLQSQTIIDSYSEIYQSSQFNLQDNHPSDSAIYPSDAGQSFTMLSSNYKITSCKFYLTKVGLPTGTGYAVLYGHTGTYGTNSTPTGSALATSEGLDVSSLIGGLRLITLNFSVAQQYEMIAGSYYCIVFENPTSGITIASYVAVGNNATSPTHSGNSFTFVNGAWYKSSADAIFYVYGITVGPIPDEDYVDSQSNVDSVVDVGTHSSFTAQKATDWMNDTLTEANTNTTKIDDTENFVDNDASDVDSHADHGTSSNFTAQQDSNVLYNDTLTEANTAGTTSNVFSSGFEETPWNIYWDGNGAATWLQGTNSTPGTPWVTHSGTNMSYALNANDGNLISDDIDLSGSSAAGISFWYMVDDEEETDFRFYYYNGSTYNLQTLDLGLAATEDIWYKYSEVITDVQYLKSNFRIDFNSLADTNEGSFIDDVLINKTLLNNYELDMEFQWTTLDYAQANEYVCIHTGSTFGAENILVKYRNGGTWNALVTMTTANTWYNTTLALASATLTLQFLGGTETEDTTQSAWMIECSLVHVWSVGVNYELQIEEQFTSANYTRANEELCIRMGTMNGETLSVQWWNTTDSSWLTIIASLSANVWNNVSVTPYLTSGTFYIRFLDGTTSGDSSQSTWDKDACLLHTWETTGAALTADLSQGISASLSMGLLWVASVGLTQAIVSVWNGLVAWVANIDLSQAITGVWNAICNAQFVSGLTQAISSVWSTATKWVASIGLSQSVTGAWSILSVWSANVGLAQSISSAWSVLNGWVSNIGLSQSVTAFWNIGVRQSLLVGLSQSVSGAWSLLAGWVAQVGLSQSLGSSFSSGIHWVANVGMSQTVTGAWSVSAISIFNVALAQGITATWTNLVAWIANIGLSQSITTVWQILVHQSLFIGVSQSISSAWSTLGNWAANIDLSQSISSLWSVASVLSHVGTYIADLSQSITMSWSMLTAWVASISLSQSLSASWNLLTQWTATVSLPQSIITSWGLATNWIANIGLTQSVTASWSVLTKWSGTIGLTQGISTAWSMLTQWTANVNLSQTLTGVWSAIVDLYHVGEWEANLSQTITASWSVLTNWVANIDLSQSVSTSWIVLTGWAGTISLGQSIVTTWSLATNWVANIGLSQSITESLSVLTQWSGTIGLTQSISTVWLILTQWGGNVNLSQALTSLWTIVADLYHLGQWEASLTQTITASWSILTTWAANVGLSYSFSSVWSAAVGWSAIVGLSQAIGTSWASLSNWVAHIDLGQSLNMNWVMLTRWAGSIGLSQSVNAAWSMLARWSGFVNLSQSLSTVWSVGAVLSHFGTWTADLTQAISMSASVITNWFAHIGLSQTLTSSWATGIHWVAHTSLSQSISTVYSMLTKTGFIINLSQAISGSWNMLIHWVANISLSQTINANWTILNHWVASIGLSISSSITYVVDAFLFSAHNLIVNLNLGISMIWTIRSIWTAQGESVKSVLVFAMFACILAIIAVAFALTRKRSEDED